MVNQGCLGTSPGIQLPPRLEKPSIVSPFKACRTWIYRGINTVDFILHSLEIILQATLQTRLDNQLVGGEVNVVDGDPPRIKKKRHRIQHS